MEKMMDDEIEGNSKYYCSRKCMYYKLHSVVILFG